MARLYSWTRQAPAWSNQTLKLKINFKRTKPNGTKINFTWWASIAIYHRLASCTIFAPIVAQECECVINQATWNETPKYSNFHHKLNGICLGQRAIIVFSIQNICYAAWCREVSRTDASICARYVVIAVWLSLGGSKRSVLSGGLGWPGDADDHQQSTFPKAIWNDLDWSPRELESSHASLATHAEANRLERRHEEQCVCAKVSSPTCTLIVTILFPFIQPVNCRKTKWKTYKASMKLTRGPCTISSGREICVPSSFFRWLLAPVVVSSCALFSSSLLPPSECGLLLSLTCF